MNSTKEYRKLASAKRAELTVHEVTVPSGHVWKLREPPIQQFVLSGKLPAALTSKMASLSRNSTGDAEADQKTLLENLTPDDLISNLEFGRDLLLFCAVDPEIAINPTAENQIAPSEILPEDFTYLISWVLTGGKSGESLGTFRSE